MGLSPLSRIDTIFSGPTQSTKFGFLLKNLGTDLPFLYLPKNTNCVSFYQLLCVKQLADKLHYFSGDDSRSGSDCSAEQDGGWRGYDDGLGGGVAAQLSTPPPQIEIVQSSVANGRGVWTRAPVPAGTRFGPFLGKWVLEPQNDEFAWEVRIFVIFCYFLVFAVLTVDTISIVSPSEESRRPFVRRAVCGECEWIRHHYARCGGGGVVVCGGSGVVWAVLCTSLWCSVKHP